MRLKEITKIGPIFIHHAISLRLTTLVVITGIVKPAIQAGVGRTITRRATIAEAHALIELNFPSAVKALHRPYCLSRSTGSIAL